MAKAMFPETVEKLGSVSEPQVPRSFVCLRLKKVTKEAKIGPFGFAGAMFKRELINALPWVFCSV